MVWPSGLPRVGPLVYKWTKSGECLLAWPNKLLLSSERRAQIDALYSLGQLV